MSWAADYIGTPWVAGVSDCWHFARGIWRDQFGWDVPPVVADAADPRAARRAFAVGHEGTGWRPVAAPAEGDAVLMAMGRHPCHVGIWLPDAAGPTVLHSVEGAGVILTPLTLLPGLGYRLVGLYRWGARRCAPR